jgi:hypothetical protein
MLFKLALLFLTASLIGPMLAQDTPLSADAQGSLSDSNLYRNAILGLTLQLPGGWLLREKGAAHGARAEGCTGPLCGDADVDAALVSTGDDDGRYKVFLAGWKLSGEYKNRSRYPLKWFAQIMTSGSLGGSNLEPLGDLTAIQLDGRPAYRLLVHEPAVKGAAAVGYVSESNGYVFLLVGHAASTRDEPTLQAALEKLLFLKPSP